MFQGFLNAKMINRLDEALGEHRPPWPRQIITPMLPSVSISQVYSSLTICSNECVLPWWWKASSKASGSLPATRSGHATTIMVFVAHLLILEDPDCHQNVISSSLYQSRPLHKISSQSVHHFMSNVAYKQSNKPIKGRSHWCLKHLSGMNSSVLVQRS